LTRLCFSATPSPATTRLDQLAPSDYGIPLIASRLTSLVSLQLFVMPRHQWLVDCRQLAGLSSLAKLRALSLESPITGATRLACLTALSGLTQLTQLVTGRLDHEAFPGRVMLGGMQPPQRHAALEWVSRLVAGRFGTLPTPPPAGQRARRASSAGVSGQAQGATPAPDDSATEVQEEEGDTEAEQGEGEVEGEDEDEPGALIGSDVDVNSDDLMFDSGAEGDAVSSDAPLYPTDLYDDG
jgi:hypothetical protein